MNTDIGGSNGRTDIFDVTFMWMVQQATRKDEVPESAIDFAYIRAKGWHKVTDPDVTDTVYDTPSGVPYPLYEPGRLFRYLDEGGGTDVLQTNWIDYGMNFDASLDFMEDNIYQDIVIHNSYLTLYLPDGKPETGLKKINGRYLYQQWLKRNYGLDIKFSDEDADNNS